MVIRVRTGNTKLYYRKKKTWFRQQKGKKRWVGGVGARQCQWTTKNAGNQWKLMIGSCTSTGHRPRPGIGGAPPDGHPNFHTHTKHRPILKLRATAQALSGNWFQCVRGGVRGFVSGSAKRFFVHPSEKKLRKGIASYSRIFLNFSAKNILWRSIERVNLSVCEVIEVPGKCGLVLLALCRRQDHE